MAKDVMTFKSQQKHFFLMGKIQREEAYEYYLNYLNYLKEVRVTPRNIDKILFLRIVGEAFPVINYKYRIAEIEPSMDSKGKLYYKEGQKVITGLSYFEWKEKAEALAPECGSQLANLYELFLWYFYRVAKGYWTLNDVCQKLSVESNYFDCPTSSHRIEVSGKRSVGGANDGIGNTQKLVTCEGISSRFIEPNSLYINCGGSYGHYSYSFPVAEFKSGCRSDIEVIHEFSTGVVVLK